MAAPTIPQNAPEHPCQRGAVHTGRKVRVSCPAIAPETSCQAEAYASCWNSAEANRGLCEASVAGGRLGSDISIGPGGRGGAGDERTRPGAGHPNFSGRVCPVPIWRRSRAGSHAGSVHWPCDLGGKSHPYAGGQRFPFRRHQCWADTVVLRHAGGWPSVGLPASPELAGEGRLRTRRTQLDALLPAVSSRRGRGFAEQFSCRI